MLYFDTLPKIIYTDANKVSSIRTNLLARASVRPQFLDNASIFYQYDIQESDTPEIIAEKYYNDPYRYWIILYINQINDPQWDWPLTSTEFDEYMNGKYGTLDVYNTVYGYTKTTTQFDLNTNTTTVNTIYIDLDTYNNTVNGSQTTYTLPTGPVTITTTKNVLSIYDYELNVNEEKRSIKILNSHYVDELESEFTKLMSS